MRLGDIKWELAFIVLLLLVLPVALWVYRDYSLGKRLEAELAALKAQGLPLTTTDLAPDPVPADQNAAVLYQWVFQADSSGRSPSFSKCSLPELSYEDYHLLCLYTSELHPEAVEFLRALFGAPGAQQAMEVIREASERPYSVFPIEWEGFQPLMPHHGHFRQASWVLVAKAALAAYDGDIDQALAWHKVIFRMSEHLASEPTLASILLSFSMQAEAVAGLKVLLSKATVQPEKAREFGAYLRDIDLDGSFAAALMGERAIGCHWFNMMCRDPRSYDPAVAIETFPGGGIMPRPLAEIRVSPLGRPLRTTDYLIYLGYMEKVLRLARLPARQAERAIRAAELDLGELSIYVAPLSRFTAPLVSGARVRRDCALARIDLCRMVLALKTHKYERAEYPDSLQELQETLEWQIPKDPFSGKAYIYTRQGDGFIIYSIGPNMIDDGGLPEHDEHGKWRGDVFDIVWECVK